MRELDFLIHRANKINDAEEKLKDGDEIDCPICKNKGYLYHVQENGHEYVTNCTCMELRRQQKLVEKSGMSITVCGQTFETFRAADAWQSSMKHKAEEYAKNPEGWFFVGGQVGSGKSHICNAICLYLMEQGNPLMTMPWGGYARKLKSVVNDFSAYANLINPLKETRFLFVDDLFKGGASEADIRLAFEILDYRYREEKATIISSEYMIDKLVQFDEAVGSRIKQRAGKNAINISADESKNQRMQQ